MTTATSPPSDAPGTDERTAPSETPDRTEAAPRRRVRSRWWRFGYPFALVVLLAAIPALVWVGLQVILDSTDGQLVRRVTDPALPGYEAVLEPTPTDLVLSVGPDGSLDSVTLVALTSEDGGGVVTIPARTVVPFAQGEVPLSFVYETLGADAVRSAVGDLTDLTFSDAQVIGSSEWARLVAPAAPITVQSPDPVVGADGTVLFPAGRIELSADEVWPYLSGRAANESDLSRLVRVQAFWRGWLDAIAVEGPSAISGPTDVGLGRFLATLAPAQVQYEVLPVTEIEPDSEGNERFATDPEAVATTIAAIVPFPEGAPGGRPRVRMLDGTGELGNGVSAAIVLAAAGAQIDVVGNARSFGQETTQVVYYEDVFAVDARRLRDALGVGEVVRSEQTNSATDLTVVLGEDYLALTGGSGQVVEPSTLEGQGG